MTIEEPAYTYRCPNSECPEYHFAKTSPIIWDDDVLCGACHTVAVLDTPPET